MMMLLGMVLMKILQRCRLHWGQMEEEPEARRVRVSRYKIFYKASSGEGSRITPTRRKSTADERWGAQYFIVAADGYQF